MKKILFSIWGLLLCTILAYGQANILPAPAQTKPVVITGATIHIGNGKLISNGYIAFDKGKITAIGEGKPASSSGADVIDGAGRQIYPGFICPNTTLGLVEVESGAKGTVDDEETGEINPNVRAIVAFNTDSKSYPDGPVKRSVIGSAYAERRTDLGTIVGGTTRRLELGRRSL